MRRIIAITLMTATVLAWWYAQDGSSVARGQVQPECSTSSGRADLNDDGSADVSDASYLLRWLFLGGPEPVACAAAPSEEDWFAKSVAGTFVVCGRNQDGVLTSRSLATVNSDGTDHTAIDDQFVPTELARYKSVMKGSWKQTGDQASFHVILQFYYDEEGQTTYIMRLRSTVTWAEDFNSYSGPWTSELFSPEAILCDPAVGTQLHFNNPEIVAHGTLSGVRVPLD